VKVIGQDRFADEWLGKTRIHSHILAARNLSDQASIARGFGQSNIASRGCHTQEMKAVARTKNKGKGNRIIDARITV
jgi:hypothetical protein